MNDSNHIFADLTALHQGREIRIKADGKTIRIYPDSVGAFFKYARDASHLRGQYRSFEVLDRLLADRGIGIAIHIRFFHVFVLGAGKSRLFHYFLRLLWKNKKYDETG